MAAKRDDEITDGGEGIHATPAFDASAFCHDIPATSPWPHRRAGRKAQHGSIAQRSIPLDCRPATEPPVLTFVVVLVLAAVVHAALAVPGYADGSRSAGKRDGNRAGSAASVATGEKAAAHPLPPLAAEMRDRIAAAVASGRIDDLQEPLDLNELPVVFSDVPGGEPIAHWKSLSTDGQGRDVLDQLGRILALPPARLALGRDPENNGVFVWPYLAERPLDGLSSAETADLATLMPPDAVAAMRARGKWTWWRLVIGADGTWHALMRGQ